MEKERKGRTHRKLPAGSTADELGEFVAASAPLHCIDGWSYLGRSLSAASRADPGAARHLAYYAELRAAIALLATRGIGVFNGSHVVLTGPGDVEVFLNARTHAFAWKALEAWSRLAPSAGNPGSGEILTDVVRPAGATLTDWISAFSGAQANTVGATYLRQWGLDVARFGKDRNARNESSYSPRAIDPPQVPTSEDTVRFMTETWELFEPQGADRFERLDLFILRRTLAALFKQRNNASRLQSPTRYQQAVTQAISTLGLGQATALLRNLLSYASIPTDPDLFSAAESRVGIADPRHHLNVAARALLLLRVATGLACDLLRTAPCPYHEFEPWSKEFAVGRGLVGPGRWPSSPQDLWDDVDGAIQDVQGDLSAGRLGSYDQVVELAARPITILGGCERIGLWALAA